MPRAFRVRGKLRRHFQRDAACMLLVGIGSVKELLEKTAKSESKSKSTPSPSVASPSPADKDLRRNSSQCISGLEY